MSSLPMLFSTPMVQAIIAGRKSVTRRLAPHGAAGDLLWVRETWRPTIAYGDGGGDVRVRYRAGGERLVSDEDIPNHWRIPKAATASTGWVTPLHMPRWASRLTLTIASIRYERLRSITEGDAKLEGVDPCDRGYVAAFARLWDDLNASRASWNSNPLVWRIEFRTELKG